MAEKITELSGENFDAFIESGNCVIDFYADWCGPCKMLAPEFEKASENIENVKFGKIDNWKPRNSILLNIFDIS